MKNILIFFLIVLTSCSGPTSPPFAFEDNTRFIIEATLKSETGVVLNNQKVELNSGVINNQNIVVKTLYSDANGSIFLSVPKANYNYFLNFVDKRIVSMQNYKTLIFKDNSTGENSGSLTGFSNSYYNLGIITLKNK